MPSKNPFPSKFLQQREADPAAGSRRQSAYSPYFRKRHLHIYTDLHTENTNANLSLLQRRIMYLRFSSLGYVLERSIEFWIFEELRHLLIEVGLLV